MARDAMTWTQSPTFSDAGLRRVHPIKPVMSIIIDNQFSDYCFVFVFLPFVGLDILCS